MAFFPIDQLLTLSLKPCDPLTVAISGTHPGGADDCKLAAKYQACLNKSNCGKTGRALVAKWVGMRSVKIALVTATFLGTKPQAMKRAEWLSTRER
jgi:hypothetical protein